MSSTFLAATRVAAFASGLVFSASFALAASPHQSMSSDRSAVPEINSSVTSVAPTSGSGIMPRLSFSDRYAEPVTGAKYTLLGTGRSVIGADGRVRILNTTTSTYRKIVQIVRVDSSGTWGCTGWMISKDTVATAGHCVHRGSGGSAGFYAPASITVYPGRNVSASPANPYGSCKARRLYTVNAWANSENENYDYGAVKLNCTVGTKTGTFGFFSTSSSLVGRAARVVGYPCDKTFGQMWGMAGALSGSNPNPRKIRYTIDTFGCQSGSPVYEVRTNGPYAMGIHAYGVSGGTNSGTRIIKEVFNNLNSWRLAP